MTRPQVVIVGAGFGGLAAAKGLADAPVDITLVDRNNFHTFQPLLYQVATSGLTPGDVAHVVRGIFGDQDNLAFRRAVVRGADLERRSLLVGHGDEIPYDHLIVAVGASTNTFDIEGVEEHGFPLYQLADAVRLRNHVLKRFEATDVDPSMIDRGALRFVVVGGGPTGVEVAGALAELFGAVLARDFPRLDLRRAEVVLVEMLPQLLAPFHPSLQRYARETLEERGVEVRTETAVDRVESERIVLEGGEELATQTVVWAAGVRANALGAALGLPTARAGRIEVGSDLAVTGHRDVWAIGDVAAIAGSDGLLPQLAPVAIQSGRHVAAQVRRTLDGRPTKAFHYRDKGTMATIGRGRAVAELPLGIRLRGFPAWLSWLGLHLVMLAGFRNRISVFVNWAWNYLTWDRGPRLILEPGVPGTGDLDPESPTSGPSASA
ncbi:MAG: NAD(P)/FAD-dependent oxidoreductase [Acidimicrobiales bacterium]